MLLGRIGVAAELVDHFCTGTWIDPNVTVDDPYYISFGFFVRPAHVPDLGVGAELPSPDCEIIFFDEKFGIMVGAIFEDLLDDRVCGVLF